MFFVWSLSPFFYFLLQVNDKISDKASFCRNLLDKPWKSFICFFLK